MNHLLRLMFDRRGITDDMLSEWNTPESDVLVDVDAAVKRLYSIRENGQKIVVLPDFDMDGIMSCVVGVAGLSELGFNVGYYVPDPSRGYGFDEVDVAYLIAEHPDVSAIITCDTGIGCLSGVEAAVARGIEVIVTDHHTEEADTSVVGVAAVTVDPCRIDDGYSHKSICGAFVLWKVLDGFARKYEDLFVQDQIARLRVFAGIGTISDAMDLKYANRQLVRDSVAIAQMVWSEGSRWFVDSMAAMSPVYRQAFVGLFSVIDAFARMGKVKKVFDINAEFYGFYLSPTFNSVKRMDGDMSRAYGVFLRIGDPSSSIDYLMQLNEERKALVRDVFAAMKSTHQPYEPYCYIVDTLPGIDGLLAMKVLTETNIPALVLNRHEDGSLSGSGRSPEWFPFLTMTRDIPEGRAAGHEGAFGFSVDSESELAAFLTELSQRVFAQYKLLPMDGAVDEHFDFVIATPGAAEFGCTEGDVGIDIDLFHEFLFDVARYAPFGHGFPAPRILLCFSGREARWCAMGADKSHLKVRLPHGFDAIVWNAGYMAEFPPDGLVRMAGSLSLNEFMGNVSVQFIADDVLDGARVVSETESQS